MFELPDQRWQLTASSPVAHVWIAGDGGVMSLCKMKRNREERTLADATDDRKCKLCLKVIRCRSR